MPGPTPKPSATRQRRNKTSTSAKLSLLPSGIKAPKLPVRKDEDGKVIKWHPQTLSWWKDVWASPMAPEFLEADVHGLFMLAELEDAFNRADKVKERIELAKEIRLQRQAFGLTPIDRRRLQWEVERTESAQAQRPKKATASKKKGADPRSHLSAV
jgi:hypothetical protein